MLHQFGWFKQINSLQSPEFLHGLYRSSGLTSPPRSPRKFQSDVPLPGLHFKISYSVVSILRRYFPLLGMKHRLLINGPMNKEMFPIQKEGIPTSHVRIQDGASIYILPSFPRDPRGWFTFRIQLQGVSVPPAPEVCITGWMLCRNEMIASR